MAAELVETSRLWGREVARIQPEWVEPLAAHLVRRTYAEPHWSRSRGAVMATERVTLYGVPIVTGRPVNYGPIDPPAARELFLRHALVEGDWDTSHAFFARNRRLLAEVEDLEHRSRRRDILVDDHTLFDFYDQRIPDEVVSAHHFDAWWKRARQDQPDLLDFERSMLIGDAAGAADAAAYPDTWEQDGHRLRLTYQFEPGSDADGVTVHVPLAVLNQIDEDGFDWQVPGLRQELVTELIRSLPKAVRRSFIPAPDWAASVLERIGPADGPLRDALARELERAGPGGGRGQRPRGAEAAAGPADAGRPRRRRPRPGAGPGAWLGPRCPAPGGGGAPGRPGRQGLPGPGRGARRRGRAPAGERGRAGRRHVGRDPPAAVGGHPVTGAVRARPPDQPGQADPEPLPARQRHRPVRRLPGRRGRRPDRRQRRPGLGRGRLQAAAGRGPRGAAGRHPGGGLGGRAGPGRGRPGRGPAGRADQPGLRPGHRRRPGPARRPRLPGLGDRHRPPPPWRRLPLPAGHGPAPGATRRRPGPRRRALRE